MLLFVAMFSFSFTVKLNHLSDDKGERISFVIKGTGSKGIFVEIGIGSQPGYGSCCSGLSPHTSSHYTAEIGEVIYDGKTRKIITKVTKDMEGKTLDLANYY